MAGSYITNRQVEIYMQSRLKGQTQVTAAAKAGISERSGRDIDHGKHVDAKTKARHWRTRKDPLDKVWQSELAPLLEQSPLLQPITLLEHLQEKHPKEAYPDSILRTLQRRVKEWRATQGPKKEVMFLQKHVAGRQAFSDFTTLKQTTITIAGQPYRHLLYHFRLAYSHWSYVKVINGGESYTALAEGLQEALQRLGGSPLEHRTDSLSAAYKNLSKEAQEDITCRYELFCENYSMKATRNNPGASHENGSIESPHGHLKRRIRQALLIRDSHDFASIEDYQLFIDHVVQQHNRRNAKAIQIERMALQPLPKHKSVDYTELTAVVSCNSTIDVRRVTYSVPSQLIGEVLNVRLYHDRLDCYFGKQFITKLNRLHPAGSQRDKQIDYRHMVHSLVKKPQAFRYSQHRDALLPTDDYKIIWSHLNKTLATKESCKAMVGLLHIAASQDCEKELAHTVLELMSDNKPIVLTQLQEKFRKTVLQPPPELNIKQHQLKSYNDLIPCAREVYHA